MAERRLFEDVADTIRRLILDGTYPPGTRLPGERELSERFEVSRVTIREAEIALQATGWIHIRTGAGAYVEAVLPGDNAILPKVSAFELTEARRSEEHTSELQSLMRISYAVFCLKKKK